MIKKVIWIMIVLGSFFFAGQIFAENNILKTKSDLIENNQFEIPTSSKESVALRFNYQNNGELLVSSASTNSGYKLSMTQVGINNTFAVSALELFEESSSVQIKSCTDWVGPMIIKALSDGELDQKPRFTGGWHGSDGGTIGSPTSQEFNRLIFANGKIVKKGMFGNANQLYILVNNKIQAYNTNRFVVSEYVLYKITSKGIEIHVILDPLENVEIERYYGLQTQNTAFNGSVIYEFQDGTQIQNKIDTENSSGKIDKANKVAKIVLTKENSPLAISAYFNYIGSFKNLDNVALDKSNAFTTLYGKSYFNLINGIPLKLSKGESVIWHGGYSYITD